MLPLAIAIARDGPTNRNHEWIGLPQDGHFNTSEHGRGDEIGKLVRILKLAVSIFVGVGSQCGFPLLGAAVDILADIADKVVPAHLAGQRVGGLSLETLDDVVKKTPWPPPALGVSSER